MAKKVAAQKEGSDAAEAPTYTKADKKLITQLQEAGVKLTGSETPEELETLAESNGLGEDSGPEVIPGVPNKVDVVFEPVEPGSSHKPFPIWHVMQVKGGFVMYDHTGRRVSHLLVPGRKMGVSEGDEGGVEEVGYHRKVAARSNAQRKAVRLPNDPA